jgi:hypothetical protein
MARKYCQAAFIDPARLFLNEGVWQRVFPGLGNETMCRVNNEIFNDFRLLRR